MIEDLEKIVKEKIEAINTIKSMLGESAKVVNPNIDGLEIAYKEIQDKITELKEKYK